MSEVKKSKADIGAKIQKVFKLGQVIDQKLDAAKASGNQVEYNSLIEELKTVKKEEKLLENQFSLLEEEQVRPDQERISKLGQELRTPYAAGTSVVYSPYGLMPNAPNLTGGNVNPTTLEQDTQRKREIVGELYNLPVGQDGREAEKIPTSLMAQVESLYDPTSKSQLLEKTYGKGNVLPVDVGGNTEFFIKSSDGGVKTTLDKGIAGLAGIAVETPVIASEIASFLGILASTKNPAAANIGSAAVGGIVGSGIDTALRFSYGLEPDIGTTIARRGTGAIIGAGAGMLTDVAIPAYRAARIPNPFENQFVKVLDESAGRLMLREEKLAASQGRVAGEVNVPVGARLAGQKGIDIESELAGKYANSGIATAKRNSQESLLRLNTDMMSNTPVTANDFSAIAVNQDGQRRALANSIARTNNKNATLIEDRVNQILKPRGKTNVDDLGKVLRNNIEIAEAQAKKSTDEQYDVLADVANSAGFKIRAEDLLGLVSKIKQQANPKKAFDESATNGVENRLRLLIADQNEISSIEKRIAGEKDVAKSNELLRQVELIKKRGDLDFKNFDDYIRAFNDARPDNAVGGTTKDALGAKVSAELSKLRKRIYSNFKAINPDGTTRNLGDEFEEATRLVQERIAFEGNTLGRVLKEVVGEQATTPRDVVSSVMKEPFTINRVLEASRKLELDDPTQAGITQKMQEMMRVQYLNDLGMGSKKGVAGLDYDQRMLDSLYGDKSAAVSRGLDSINGKLRVLKSANVPQMTLTDLNSLSSALSQDARDEVANGIIKRNALERQEEALVTSSIFNAAKKGNFKDIDPDLLSKSILSKENTIKDTETVMVNLSKLSPESRNLFKGDFRRNLLDDYSGGESTVNAPFMPLFDTKKFLSDYETSPGVTSVFGKKLEIVLGKEEAQGIADIARLNNANIITDTSATGFAPRFTATNNAVILGIPFGQLASSVRNRYITAMLSSGSQRNTLKRALARNAMPGAVNKAYNDMARDMFLTRTGLTALAHQASSDPEFSAELTNMAKQFKEKESLNLYSK
jgi:hypothetical protein